MSQITDRDDMNTTGADRFRLMVESVGVKRFASEMGLSTRQINRMLSGAQPNPIDRIIRSLQCCQPEVGDETLSYICQETGGHFVKEVGPLDMAAVNAVKESAEAIAAISDGEISAVDEKEVRDAISALIGLLRTVQESRQIQEARGVVQTRPIAPAPTRQP